MLPETHIFLFGLSIKQQNLTSTASNIPRERRSKKHGKVLRFSLTKKFSVVCWNVKLTEVCRIPVNIPNARMNYWTHWTLSKFNFNFLQTNTSAHWGFQFVNKAFLNRKIALVSFLRNSIVTQVYVNFCNCYAYFVLSWHFFLGRTLKYKVKLCIQW